MKIKLSAILTISLLLSACGSGDNTDPAQQPPASAESSAGVSELSAGMSELKAQAIEACNAQISQLPDEMKQAASKVCECTAENMDYAKLEELSLAGKTQEAMALSVETAQKCGGDS